MPRISSRELASALLSLALVAWAVTPAAAEDELPPFVGTEASQDALVETLATSRAWQFKPIGHTSVLFRMRTVSHVTAGYKVKSRGLETGYRSEIAAYRLSRLLRLDNVPPTVFRRATQSEIKNRFHEEKRYRWKAVRRATSWEEDGTVVGSAAFWVKKARRGLVRSRDRWQTWLRVEGAIPSSKKELARDLSTMTLFDFLVANWDRYSGGNLLMSPARERAVLVDHDRAFAPLGEDLYVRLLRDLTATERFSNAVIDRLLVLDRQAIEDELSKDPSHASAPLLDGKQIDALLDRRETILSHVAALVEEHGEAKVLFFP